MNDAFDRFAAFGPVALLAVAAGCAATQVANDASEPGASQEAREAALGQPYRHFPADECAECHREIYDSYAASSHPGSMREIEPGALDDRFGPAHYRFELNEAVGPISQYRLAPLDGDYHQFLLAERDGKLYELKRLPLHVEVGTGKYGQSYLRWDGDRLFQLPLSYYPREKSWGFGPGFFGVESLMAGDRRIFAGCLDCHAGYIEGAPEPDGNALYELSYERNGAMLSITCTNCHGPAEEHLAFHRANPSATEARHVAHLAGLDRERQLDVCGRCHQPPGERRLPVFTYRPGDDWQDHMKTTPIDVDNPTPHGTQEPLLRASRCFQASPNMTCSTCHDPHRYERGDLAHFSAKCLNCHQTGHACKETSPDDAQARANCIDCHMPITVAGHLQAHGAGGKTWDIAIRTHRIMVYGP